MARAYWTVAALSILALCGCRDKPNEITLFAAASTTDAISELAQRYEGQTGTHVLCNFGASAVLARQIESGARADLFLSASPEWMDYLQHKDLIEPATRRDLLGNTLVWVVRLSPTAALPVLPTSTASSPTSLTPAAGLPASRGDHPASQASATRGIDFTATHSSPPDLRGRLAIGDPAYVPAGQYARQALEHLGWWAPLQPRIITAPDVRAALRLVEMGEAEAGIVYATDVAAARNVVVAATFPPDTHDAIRYPLARCRGARAPAAGFQEFLLSNEAATTFRKHGFVTGAGLAGIHADSK
jgi:molybdate transport system substrate-binding protein